MAMNLRLALFAFAAAADLAAAAPVSGSELDLAYRADQTAFHLPEAAPGSKLPRRLEEYEPRPQPPAAAVEASAPPRKTYADVWDRVRAGFALPKLESPLVAHWQAFYLNRPQLVKAMLERSRLYLYHVVEELDKRGMPTELVFLPMVESGYNPKAFSSARAAGLWQFVPSTGKEYKLGQGFVYDNRRDILASTAAALTYLQSLFGKFGDWQLALAAYNAGEGAVAKAIARNKARGLPAGYRTLALPEETRNYLPKLQALKNLVANPGAYNIQIEPAPNTPYFAAIAAERYLDVDVAAKLAGLGLDEFLALNPAFNLNLIFNGPNTRIVLPVDKVDAFLSNLDSYKEPPVGSRDDLRNASSKPKPRAASEGASAR